MGRPGKVSRKPVGSEDRWVEAISRRRVLGIASRRRETCDVDGKISYLYLEEAWVECLHDRPDIDTLGVYPCDDSGHFHLGNKARSKMGTLRRRARREYERALRSVIAEGTTEESA